MTKNANYQIADDAFQSGIPLVAFVNYLAVAVDIDLSDELRAKAWAMMGRLVAIVPDLSVGDNDTGLFYNLKAIELDANCIDAHFGVVLEYGLDCGWHTDKEMYSRSAEYLVHKIDKLNDSMRRSFVNKLEEFPVGRRA